LASFLEILTETSPDDPRMKALRARLFSIIVSKLTIDDDGSGPITITIEGPLVPPDSPVEMGNPLHAAGDFLDSYTREKQGLLNKADQVIEAVESVKTDLESSHSKSVSIILPKLRHLPTGRELRRLRRISLTSESWHLAKGLSKASHSRPVWAAAVAIDTERALTIGLTPIQREIIDLLRDQPVLSRTSLHLATGSVPRRSALQSACAVLNDRGVLATALAPGHTGFSTLWCLTDAFRRLLGESASSPHAATARGHANDFLSGQLDNAGQAEHHGTDPNDANLKLAGRYGQQVRRRIGALERAHVGSMAIDEAIQQAGLTPEELIGAIDEARLMAVVCPGGEVRLPRWQFDQGLTVAQDLPELIEAVASRRVPGLGLHLAITKPSALGRGPSVSDQLISADQASRPAVVAKAMELMNACISESTRRSVRRASSGAGSI
jgi:hypothetical protein